MNKTELDIQVQAHNRKYMEVEHMIAKELILGHESYEKLDNNNGLQVSEVNLFYNISLRLYILYKNI